MLSLSNIQPLSPEMRFSLTNFRGITLPAALLALAATLTLSGCGQAPTPEPIAQTQPVESTSPPPATPSIADATPASPTKPIPNPRKPPHVGAVAFPHFHPSPTTTSTSTPSPTTTPSHSNAGSYHRNSHPNNRHTSPNRISNDATPTPFRRPLRQPQYHHPPAQGRHSRHPRPYFHRRH